eukprot:jgi/Mesen1/3953/ME000209S02963
MLLQYHELAKLQTKGVSYEDKYYARDSGTLNQLKELSARRLALEESLNGKSRLTEAIAREIHGGISSPILQKLQQADWYIPLLVNLTDCVVAQQAKPRICAWTRELSLRWTSVLSRQDHMLFKGPKFYRVDDLRFELAMVLTLHAALLREHAMETLATDKKEVVKLLRMAAGTFEHLSQGPLLELQLAGVTDRPPEAVPAMADTWRLVCLAEAQAVTAAEAEAGGRSKRLLASLHRGVGLLITQALARIAEHQSQWRELSDKFLRYLKVMEGLHQARSLRHLAEDVRAASQGHMGAAIGVLQLAAGRLRKVERPVDEDWKRTYDQEASKLEKLHQSWDLENLHTWREKVPPEEELPHVDGDIIVTTLPFTTKALDREFIFVT